MSITQRALIVLVLVLAGACDRNEIDPAENSEALRTRELPAEVSVREKIAQDEGQASRDQSAGPTVATRIAPDEGAEAREPARRAEAALDGVGKAELEARATFEESADGVAVRVNVSDAKPGTRSVRIYERADCDDLDDAPLGKPFASSNKHGDLGSVTIGASGKGTLETKAFNTSLKPDDRASLLGKTIVVQERAAGSPKAAGGALACGVIRGDAPLADKAGRMVERSDR